MQKPGGNQTTAAGGKPITTFVQTDTKAFRDIVQRLTGPSEIDPTQLAAAAAIPKVAGSKRSTSKLHERRKHNLTRPKLEIVKPPINFKPNLTSPNSRSSSLHPSPVGTPSTVFSKLTLQEQENKAGSESPILLPDLNGEEEEKAIKERRFYLHPSPRSRQGSAHELPELLTLFPLTSTENE